MVHNRLDASEAVSSISESILQSARQHRSPPQQLFLQLVRLTLYPGKMTMVVEEAHMVVEVIKVAEVEASMESPVGAVGKTPMVEAAYGSMEGEEQVRREEDSPELVEAPEKDWSEEA
jgi:hypothetical protein